MDGHSIDRIRNARFAHAVRGYDRHEVDEFLRELADWLENDTGEAARSEATRAELQRVAEQTAGILAAAHETAESIRDDAATEARQKLVDANLTAESVRGAAGEYSEEAREQADAYARKARSDADEYARTVRADADTETEEIKQAGRREAERILEEASTRRREIESVITGLEQRRDGVVAELERLASGIGATATKHRGGPRQAQDEAIDGIDVAGAEAEAGPGGPARPAADPAARGATAKIEPRRQKSEGDQASDADQGGDPAEAETTEREAVTEPVSKRREAK